MENTNNITATYSAEDNKLRLYAEDRLDSETFQRVKDEGFKWAPRQGLFVAPKWTPTREDLCLSLAGDIEAEEMTLAERAAIKADRLDGYAMNRRADASAYHQAALRIGERFASGQPILVGHHSERRARRDQEKMNSAAEKAGKAAKLVNYWAYRAEGVERHANYKNKPAVRARRIKTLLAELRDFQRIINHHHKALKLWEKVEQEPDTEERHNKIEYYCGAYSKEGCYGYSGAWSALDKGEIDADEVLKKSIEAHQNSLNSDYYPRWIEHILNRLGYEAAMLGEVPLFDGELTPVILQGFARTHGADKPKAKNDGELWTVTSLVALPVHLLNALERNQDSSESLSLTASQWRELMQQCGYDVPANQPRKPKRTAPPLLNVDTSALQTKHSWNGSIIEYEVKRMTKAEYKRYSTDARRTTLSIDKQFRFRTLFIRDPESQSSSWKAVFITDAKSHPVPNAAI